MNQMNTAGRRENQTTPHKTTNNKPPHLGDEITKKNLDLCEKSLT